MHFAVEVKPSQAELNQTISIFDRIHLFWVEIEFLCKLTQKTWAISSYLR